MTAALLNKLRTRLLAKRQSLKPGRMWVCTPLSGVELDLLAIFVNREIKRLEDETAAKV